MSASYQRSDRLFRGSGSAPNPGGVRTTFAQQTLSLTHQPGPRWEFGLTVPRASIRRREGGVPDLDLDGLGDIAVFAQFAPWRGEADGAGAGGQGGRGGRLFDRSGFSFLLGLELPTGDDEDTPVPGVTTPSLLQLGSGTWDPIVGWGYTSPTEPWRAFHHTVLVLPLGESDADLAPGETAEVVTGLSYDLAENLTLSTSLDFLLRGRDKLRGSAIDNTGAALGFVSPGIGWRPRDNLSVEGTVRLPVYRDVRSTQLAPGPRFELSLQVRF